MLTFTVKPFLVRAPTPRVVVSALSSAMLMFVCGSTSADEAPVMASSMTTASSIVKIDNFTFSPQTLQVAVGTTVTWKNNDDMPHTVLDSARPARFSSPPLDTNDQFSYRFTKPGRYPYFCSIHPRMTGLIVVK